MSEKKFIDGEGLRHAWNAKIKPAIDLKANGADVYRKEEVDAKVSSVYRIKGSVANEASLPTENLVVGDVYNLLDTGMNVVYTGQEGNLWDKLGSVVDLSNCVKYDDLVAVTNAEIDALFEDNEE